MITPFRFKQKDGSLAWGMAAGPRGSHTKFSAQDAADLKAQGFTIMEGDEVAFPGSSYEPIKASDAANFIKYNK